MRPIDADAFLKDILTAGIGKTIIEYSESDIGYMIRKRPTIDAVPVVRCRECKYSRINHLMKKDILSCENIDVCGEEYLFERNPNDFCSYGERKEGADNG